MFQCSTYTPAYRYTYTCTGRYKYTCRTHVRARVRILINANGRYMHRSKIYCMDRARDRQMDSPQIDRCKGVCAQTSHPHIRTCLHAYTHPSSIHPSIHACMHSTVSVFLYPFSLRFTYAYLQLETCVPRVKPGVPRHPSLPRRNVKSPILEPHGDAAFVQLGSFEHWRASSTSSSVKCPNRILYIDE